MVEGPLSILLAPSVSQDGGCTGCLTDPWAKLALIARACLFAVTANAEDTWADSTWPSVDSAKPLGPWRKVTNCPRLPFPRNDSTYCDANVVRGAQEPVPEALRFLVQSLGACRDGLSMTAGHISVQLTAARVVPAD